ncbi:MAG: hypothetical protein IKW12_00205 [Clostridia bacterium]|nr:hypothetical protein [Clostridia bacterium]
MRKFLSLILVFVVAFSFSSLAFADMDGPAFTNFDVVVTNLLGTYMFSYDLKEVNGFLPKDTVVTINGEYEMDDEEYYSIEYNEKYGYIKVADTALTEDIYAPEKGYKLDKETKSIVISNGLYMYKGPSEKFEKFGEEIPVGTVLTYRYANAQYDPPWAYVTYNGVSGWVYIYEYGVAFYCATLFEEDSVYSGDLYVVLDGVRLTNIPENPEYEQYRDEDEKTGAEYVTKEIPVGTRLEFDNYYYKNAKSIWVYTEYNGVKGWIETDTGGNGGSYNATAIGMNGAYYVWQKDGFPVYSKAGDTSSKVIGKLEKGDFVQTKYVAYNDEWLDADDNPNDSIYNETMLVDKSWYGVEIDGELGWIYSDCTDKDEGYMSLMYWDFGPINTVNKEVNLLSKMAEDSDVIATIPANTVVIAIAQTEDYILVDYDGKMGYVTANSLVEKTWEEYEADNYSFDDYFAGRKAEETTLPETIAQPTTQAVSEMLTEAETEAEKIEENTEKNSFTPTQIAIFCGAGAVIIALTAAVTIILINKKKKA